MRASKKNKELTNSAYGNIRFCEKRNGTASIITHSGEVVPGVGSPGLYW
ncbi:MAG: hypothetical protein J0M37_00060 [Ignavibacteria bacterium]|nr:hypothetical protein [Ignavibacteria bacterium]